MDKLKQQRKVRRGGPPHTSDTEDYVIGFSLSLKREKDTPLTVVGHLRFLSALGIAEGLWIDLIRL